MHLCFNNFSVAYFTDVFNPENEKLQFLCLANGIVNGIGFILEKEAGLPKGTRWIITCFAPPIVLLVPAAIKMAKGEKNGQYNVGKILFPKTMYI